MSDCVRVGVRLRPLNSRERRAAEDAAGVAGAAGVAWEADAAVGEVRGLGRPAKFSYDHVFEATARNEDVFAELAQPVVDAALAGYNGTIFAYGQTSAGKTHSMLGDAADPGVTPRAVAQVMRVAEEAAGGRRYSVRATYCEIYNEVVRDLLNVEAGEIRVRENSRGVTFLDAREVPVASVAAAMGLLEQGQAVRSVGETSMNATSSRSHTIFTLIIESVGEAVGAEKCRRSAFLHLVDLAGSERAKSTHASGARLREGSHINKSLLTLGTIINKLSAEGGAAALHLPYRDSKLTRVLRDALGGNSRTAVLCAVTPSPMHVEETLSTLKFAERAKNVTNSAVKNETVDYKAKYREALAELEVLRAGGGGGGGGAGGGAGGGGGGGGLAESELLALNVELHRSREEVARLRERAETAELDAAHGAEALRAKAGEVRALRAEAAKLHEDMHAAAGKQETLQLSLAQAFFKIEDARRSIQLSRKKGSRVLQAEEDLYAVVVKLAMFIPDEMHEERRAAVAGVAATLPRPAASLESRSVSNRSAGSTSGGSVCEEGDGRGSSPPSPAPPTGGGGSGGGGDVGSTASGSPLTPEGSDASSPARRERDSRRVAGGSRGGSPREEECDSSGNEGEYGAPTRLPASQREQSARPTGPSSSSSPIPVLDFDNYDAGAEGGTTVGSGGIMDTARKAWKRKPTIKSFTFYGSPTSGSPTPVSAQRKVSLS